MKKNDYIVMIIITVLYAIVAFKDLGNIKNVETFVEFSKGDVIEVSFDKKEKIDTIHYYNGWVEECNYRLKLKTSKKEKINEKNSMANAFTWSLWSVDVEGKVKNLKIELLSKESAIGELVFLDENKNIIKPKNIKVNGKIKKELYDENDLKPKKSTFSDSPYFDENLYVTTAYNFMNGRYSYERTHPPLGKWFIALGMKIFGVCPFGWRFIGTLFGVLMLPLIYILAKKMFDKTLYAGLACAMFALDFMHFVQTRIATIDVYVTLFIICMYYFMYLYYVSDSKEDNIKKTWNYLVLSGISMGLAIASKWTGCYAAVGLAIIFFITLYRKYKEHIDFKKYCKNTILVCVVSFVIIPLGIYIISYIPYIEKGHEDMSYMEKVIDNQKYMFTFHSKLKESHTHESRWYTWPIVYKPVFYMSRILSATHRQGINAMGNPFIWWIGILAFIYMIYRIIKEKDKTALFITIGYLSQLVPWMFVTRMTFIYHYFTSVPFVVLMNVYMFKCILDKEKSRKMRCYLAFYMIMLVVLFIMFYPVLSGQDVSAEYVDTYLRWFESWDLVS